MGGLEIPSQLAGLAIQRQEAGGVKILAWPCAAEVLIRGIASRQEHQPIGSVDGHGHPTAGAASILPAIETPLTEILFARVRNDVETPNQFAGEQIEGARIARRT